MSSLLDNLNKIKTKIEGNAPSSVGVAEPSLKEDTPSVEKTETPASSKRERSPEGDLDDDEFEDTDAISVTPSKKVKTENNNGEASDALGSSGSNNNNSNSNNNNSTSNMSIASIALQQNGPGLSGTHLSTKLLLATEYIQDRGEPVSISQVESYLSLNPNSPEANNVIQLLKNINKIKFDEENQTLQYVSIYDIHTAEDLIELLRKQVTFKGISVKELKDGWPKCTEIIDDLERRGRVLVLRTKKDGTARFVWYNSYKMPEKIRSNIVKSLSEDNARPYQQFIGEDFRKMWEDVKLPSRADIPRKLDDLGLKPASVDPASVIKKGTITRVEVKRRKMRKSKITNTHMTGLLKDYSDRM